MRVVDESPRSEDEDLLGNTLDELAREGARWMLMTALEAEVAAHIERHSGGVGPQGQRSAHRRGGQPARLHQQDPAAVHAVVAEGGGGPANTLPVKARAT